MVCYKYWCRGDRTPRVHPNYEGDTTRITHLRPMVYPLGVVGGSSDPRLLLWNVQSINTETFKKLEFVKAASPIAAAIIESRDRVPENIAGYRTINGIGRLSEDGQTKVNACLVVNDAVRLERSRTSTDMVCAVISGPPIGEATFVAAVYLRSREGRD